MFNLFFKGIERDVKLRVAALLEWWAVRCANYFAQQVDVYCLPAMVITDGEDGFGFAAFSPDPDNLRIAIGGVQVPDLEREDWLYHLEENVLHELAHYLQFSLDMDFNEDQAEEMAFIWHREYRRAKG